MRLLGDEVDGRRRALLPPADVAQIKALAEPALGGADQQDGIARTGKADARARCHVGDDADAADRRCRKNAASGALVVKRDVARHDREIEYPTGLADATDAADELPHDLGLLWIAEIEVVGRRTRQGTGSGDVAPRLCHSLLAALERVRLAIALGDVGGERDAFGPFADADHGRVAALGGRRCCPGSGDRTAPRPNASRRHPAPRGV